jgi:Asp-tRNA(Asn)/Glu-tRNA(Gln) amidotransferase A subunit family amidase
MPDLTHLSAHDALRRLSDGTLTTEALMRALLERIAEREPAVGAWQHLDPEQALAAARARDKAGMRGALHGLPIGVKDIMETADMPTTHGSRAYEGYRPRADAACVALARAAGAIVLGKTVTTEFAAGAPGKTRNPHNPAHTPGGSSSGSAAGVADRMMPLAFGTQSAGSIIRPASFCGVVGYKPSFGTIPLSGTKALAESFDTIGGMARSVRPNLVPKEPYPHPRIGLYRTAEWGKADAACQATIERAAERLSRAGASVQDRPPFPAYDGIVDVHLTQMTYEAGRNLAWERANRLEVLQPRSRELLRDAAAITVAGYDAARQATQAARTRVGELFGDFDALLVPAAPGEAPARLDMTGDPIFNRTWTLLQLPCVTVPAGRGSNGLPIGIQLVGRLGDDARTLAIAQFAEQALT